MRGQKGVAHRYAEALVNIMADTGDYQVLDREFEILVKILHEHPGIMEVIEDPSLARMKKTGFIAELADLLQLGEVCKGLLHLLISKERFAALEAIAIDYRRQYKDRLGILEVEVKSVAPLSDLQVTRIEQMVQRITGKTAEIRQIQDPEILGGLVVRMGNKVLDGSVVNQLQQIQRRLVGTTEDN